MGGWKFSFYTGLKWSYGFNSLLASFEKEPSFFDGVVGMIDANLDAVKRGKSSWAYFIVV